MPLFEQSIPINRDEISKIVAQHWDIELGGIIKASQNHTFLATKKSNQDKVNQHLNDLQEAAIKNENLFEHLMEATKVCSLGQITIALFEVGGQYRRNM
jgi:methylmalonyl-CoA mutase N-terminal domain/subunit